MIPTESALKQSPKQAEFVKIAKKKQISLFCGGLQSGKCWKSDQGILLADGSAKPAYAISPGDFVLAWNRRTQTASPARVVSVSRTRKRCLRVHLPDGSSFAASYDHRFPVANHRKRGKAVVERTLEEIVRDKARHKAFLSPKFTDFGKEKLLPIPPYALGALLGDGSFSQNTVLLTAGEPELVSAVPEQIALRPHRNPISFGVGTVYRDSGGHSRNLALDALRELNLAGKNSYTKFIPLPYKTASKESRLEILAGLVDTDGYVSPRHSVDFSTCSKQLAEDVQFIVRSLGSRCSIRKRITRRQTGVSCVSYRIHFTLREPLPLRISRKREAFGAGGFRMAGEKRRMSSWEDVGIQDCVDIGIDHPDHCLLLENFVVTHNSVSGADAVWALLYDEGIELPPQTSGQMHPEVWILSRTYALAQTAWDYFKWRCGVAIMSDEECRSYELKRNDPHTYWLRPLNRKDRMPIRLRVRSTSDPEALRATANLLVAWADETAHWKEQAWRNLTGRAVVTPTRFILTTTPKGKNWLFKEVFLPGVQGDEKIGVIRCRSEDSPWADKDYINRLRRVFGPQYAAQELDAEFVAFEGQVYRFDDSKLLLQAPPLNKYERIVLGVDPGWSDAYAVAYFGKADDTWYLFDETYEMRRTTDDIADLIREKVKGHRIDSAWVDPRRPTDIAQLRRQGILARPARQIYAEKTTRTIMPGIRLCQWLMNEAKFKVDRSKCSYWLEEVYEYSYKSTDDRNHGENPVDWRNHLMDAMRYAMTSEEGLNFAGLFPRYRVLGEGIPRAPNGVKVSVKIPSVLESLKVQDEAWEKESAKLNARSSPVPRNLRSRIRHGFGRAFP